MKILVFGAGVIGSVYAAKLYAAGMDVPYWFVAKDTKACKGMG